MNICRKVLLSAVILVLFCLCCSGCENQATKKSTEKIEQTVIGYYKAQYDAYISLQYKDLKGYLDMDSTPARNLEAYSRVITERRRYIKEKNYYDISTGQYVFRVTFKNLKFSGDNSATVAVEIIPNDEKASPPWFVLPKTGEGSGTNLYTLKKSEDKWLITDFDFSDTRLNALKKGTVSFDKAAIDKEIDTQYSH